MSGRSAVRPSVDWQVLAVWVAGALYAIGVWALLAAMVYLAVY